jgi:hypothetical protein
MATTFRDAGTALGLLLKAGLNVDRIDYAQRFGIKLDPKQPLTEPQLDSAPNAPDEPAPEEDADTEPPDEGSDETPDKGDETP